MHGIAAGLHLLVTLPERARAVDDVVLAARARQAGVLVHPLSRHRGGRAPAGLVLGYAAHGPDRLDAAAAVIADTVRSR